jgi:hypothetical protein
VRVSSVTEASVERGELVDFGEQLLQARAARGGAGIYGLRRVEELDDREHAQLRRRATKPIATVH